jgi:hypothetical protein
VSLGGDNLISPFKNCNRYSFIRINPSPDHRFKTAMAGQDRFSTYESNYRPLSPLTRNSIPIHSKRGTMPPLMVAKLLSLNSSKKLSESTDKSEILIEAMRNFPSFLLF